MISAESQGAVTVLTPDTPITGEHAEELSIAVEKRLSAGLPMMVLDLSGVAMLDSAGLEAVLDARDAVRSRGGLIKLAGPTPLVEDILAATGVGDQFEQFDNSKAAVGSFAR